VLKGAPLFQSSTNERWRWAEGRKTKRDEDRAYCLQGIFGIELALVYGEGESGAFDRLKHEVSWLERCMEDMQSINPRDDKKRIEETKGGLLANSYCWVLDNTAFRQWHEDKHSRLLWVKGDPSKGKTMLLCGVINELQVSYLRLPSYRTSSARRPIHASTVLQLCCGAYCTCLCTGSRRLHRTSARSTTMQAKACSRTRTPGSPYQRFSPTCCKTQA
jgi:hypothetical protein